jgi:hypothetical protein
MQIPYRQIHLDFHTSPDIHDVGIDFNPEAFIKTLKEAHVNGINIFAKCHHGMSYYKTNIGRQHPSCNIDLLASMLSALEKENIPANIYFPIGWEETAAENEAWLEVSPEGILGGKKPFEDAYYTWRKLCLNNKEYRAFIKKQVKEIMDKYRFSGFWFDIIFQEQCLCKTCMAEMKANNMNPTSEAERLKHDFKVLKEFQKDIYQYVKEIDENKTVFFNSPWTPDGGYEKEYNIEERSQYQTHIEVESLPSELWGYNLFPLYVNYHNRNNGECIGMNGKFHNAWGDFGSLRNEEALEFECFRMLMNGSKCSIGDQLHPRGVPDEATYKRIGHIYSQIEAREEWCIKDKKIAEIGIIMAHQAFEKEMLPDEGALRMMLELKQQFDFIDWQDDFSKYRLLILPDFVYFDQEAAEKISAYIEKGGKVIASHKSGLDIESDAFIFKEAAIEYKGDAEYTPMYIDLRGYKDGIDDMIYSLYETGSKVMAKNTEQIEAALYKPYFNRKYDRFCSHRQFPYDTKVEEAGIVKTENVIYISHPLFTDYMTNGVRVYREIIQNSIHELIGKTIIETNLPNSAEVTVRKQGNRLIVHMSHYIAEKKSKKLELVDTKLPVYNIEMTINIGNIMGQEENKPQKVYLAPERQEIDFDYREGRLMTKIERLYGHSMLVIEF